MATVLPARHGRTTAIATGQLAGRTPEVALNQTGRDQAALTGERLAAARDEHWYPPQGDLLAEVWLGLLLEGTGTYFVGLNAETEFQLSPGDDPHRVILDFATH